MSLIDMEPTLARPIVDRSALYTAVAALTPPVTPDNCENETGIAWAYVVKARQTATAAAQRSIFFMVFEMGLVYGTCVGNTGQLDTTSFVNDFGLVCRHVTVSMKGSLPPGE